MFCPHVAIMIPRRPLPERPLTLSELSLGCAQLGNLYRAVSDHDAQVAIDAAWQLGVRYFDTAPHYGLGLSERRLGSALASRPRGGYVLSSKVGRLLEPVEGVEGMDDQGFVVRATHRRVWDFSRDGIRRSLEGSLERLGVDRLDIVYLHDPDDHWSDVLATGYPALDELRAEGVVSAVGAGMNQAAMLARLVRETDLDVVMLAGRYTLLEQGALDDLLPLCEERRWGSSRQVSSTAVFSPKHARLTAPSTTTRIAPPEFVRPGARNSPGLRAARDDASGRSASPSH